ncbi:MULTISPECIES: hypothetical protein [Halorussus]|uniref:hypothetical protein n=1 Tax=Halorussus TaxID=1070314 RepID=UPI00209D5D32|nr:hypothetical protein [Halorussus vallis]USZ74688.1 hypothetical protein NGM07_14740 [Halorussus vallis]
MNKNTNRPNKSVEEPLKTDGDIQMETIRDETEERIEYALSSKKSVLIDSPPNSGKTTSTFKVAKQTDTPITYLTARNDLYDQAISICKELGLSPKQVPSPHRDCPSFRGDEGSQVEKKAKELYQLGVSAKRIHSELNLPCSPDCKYLEMRSDLDSESAQVIIGNYKHAYIESILENRVVVMDEFPGDAFETEFSQVSKTISQFLEEKEGLPYDEFTDLIETRDGTDETQKALSWFFNYGADEDVTSVLNKEEYNRYHTLAPFLCFALLRMKNLGNGFEATGTEKFEDYGIERKRIAVHNRKEGWMTVLTPPDFSSALGLVCLDGTPTTELWELVTDEELDIWTILDDADKDSYIKDAMGVTIKQAGQGTKPYSGGNIAANRDAGLFMKIEVEEGQSPALITPKKALKKYEKNGIVEQNQRTKNFAEIHSSNDFANEPLGVISGSPHPRRAILQKWAAYFGEGIEPEGRGTKKSFGELGNKIYRHFSHHQVLQAILRFGRGDAEATVYLNTLALPNWLTPDSHVDVQPFNSENRRQVSQILQERGQNGAKKELLEKEVGCSKRTITKILRDFEDDNIVKKHEGIGRHGANIYVWDI